MEDSPRKKRRISDTSNDGGGSGNVRVITRIRPLNSKEEKEKATEVFTVKEQKFIHCETACKSFEFDAVLPSTCSQKEVYECAVGGSLKEKVLQGYNTTILAYGQTGSGKTFTMTGCKENQGVIPRAIQELFDARSEYGDEYVKIELSFMEIYNEMIRDLLLEDRSNKADDLHVRDSAEGGTVVVGLTNIEVRCPDEVFKVMDGASERRSVGSTAMNAVSSRSHAICTLQVTISPRSGKEGNSKNINSVESEMSAKLTLVDLAGSERLKRTGAEGARKKEGININKGLFILGQVISGLSELSQKQQQESNNPSSSNHHHIPYRDSKLTRLLQDSLGGNSNTVMISCVSPADTNLEESINTLRYAQRARNIRNSAVQNIVATMTAVEAAALRRENQMLKLQLLQAQAQNNGISTMKVIDGTCVNNSAKCDIFVKEEALRHSVVDVNKLDLVKRLRANNQSLVVKIENYEKRIESSVGDILSLTIKVDNWRNKYESLLSKAREKGIKDIDGHNNTTTTTTLVEEQRKEIEDLKDRLREALLNSEMAYATASAVVAGDGDLDAAESYLAKREANDLDDDASYTDDTPLRRQREEKLSAEIVQMGSDIERKQEEAAQMMKENSCFNETLRDHFESAIESLQKEVDALTEEKMALQESSVASTKASSLPNNKSNNDARVKELESKIKMLNQKLSEHSKTLLMRKIAEDKCARLQSDITETKKRKLEIQKKLKEESVDRRNEQKAARTQAAKLMRDGQKLRMELHKVKEAAAKQANVLRRKAVEAATKQKVENELRKRQKFSRTARTTTSSFKLDNIQRKDEVLNWLNREIEVGSALQSIKKQLEIHQSNLNDAQIEKDLLLRKRDSGADVSSHLRNAEQEIETRTAVISQLERSVQDLNKGDSKKRSCFIDNDLWQSLSRHELRFLVTSIFNQFLSAKNLCDEIKSKNHQSVVSAVNKEIMKLRREHDEEVSKLRLEHSESIISLLDATKGTVENKIKKEIFLVNDEDGIDPSLKSAVDEMLSSYFNGCEKANMHVKTEIERMKSYNDDVCKTVHDVAKSMISKCQKAAATNVQQELNNLSDDYDSAGCDSDWDINEDAYESEEVEEVLRPISRRKRGRASSNSRDETGSPSTENEQHTELPPTSIDSLKVAELRVLLKEKGLPITGRKSDLIARLYEYDSSSSENKKCSENEQGVLNHGQSMEKSPTTPHEKRKPLALKSLNDTNKKDPNSTIKKGEDIEKLVVKKQVTSRKRKNCSLRDGAKRRREIANCLARALEETENVLNVNL